MNPVLLYFARNFTAADQLANTIAYPILNLFLGNGSYKFGHQDETLSSVMGKNVRSGHCKGCYFICKDLNVIEFWKTYDHCERVIEDDEHAGIK